MNSTRHEWDEFPYGLTPVLLEDARDAIGHCHGDEAGTVWAGLLASAGLTGDETDEHSLTLLLEVMAGDDDQLTALCAHSLRIRGAAYSHFTDAHLRRYENGEAGLMAA